MDWIKELLGLNKTKLEKLVEANQKLGKKIDGIREQRRALLAKISEEMSK